MIDYDRRSPHDLLCVTGHVCGAGQPLQQQGQKTHEGDEVC